MGGTVLEQRPVEHMQSRFGPGSHQLVSWGRLGMVGEELLDWADERCVSSRALLSYYVRLAVNFWISLRFRSAFIGLSNPVRQNLRVYKRFNNTRPVTVFLIPKRYTLKLY